VQPILPPKCFETFCRLCVSVKHSVLSLPAGYPGFGVCAEGAAAAASEAPDEAQSSGSDPTAVAVALLCR